MAKRLTLEQMAFRSTVGLLLNEASTQANGTGNSLILGACNGLRALNEVKPKQIEEVLGLIGGEMELSKRYAGCCKREQAQAAEEGEHDSLDCVPVYEARSFVASSEQAALIRCYVFLTAAFNQLTATGKPSVLQDMIPVPDKGANPASGTGYPKGNYNSPQV